MAEPTIRFKLRHNQGIQNTMDLPGSMTIKTVVDCWMNVYKENEGRLNEVYKVQKFTLFGVDVNYHDGAERFTIKEIRQLCPEKELEIEFETVFARDLRNPPFKEPSVEKPPAPPSTSLKKKVAFAGLCLLVGWHIGFISSMQMLRIAAKSDPDLSFLGQVWLDIRVMYGGIALMLWC